MTREEIRKQAELLAADNKKANSQIEKIYWFPDDNEVRLVEVEKNIPKSLEGKVEPFYFPPSVQDQLPAPSGVAIIKSGEEEKLQLPANWGDWDSAELLDVV